VRLLLDENVPVQLLPALTCVLPAHAVEHIDELGWKGKKDRFLLPDAAAAGYHAIVTIDRRQLDDPEELKAIKVSGLHHITFSQGKGVSGLARAIASLIAAMPPVMVELVAADGQRLVSVQALKSSRRHATIDPRKNPPPYWR